MTIVNQGTVGLVALTPSTARQTVPFQSKELNVTENKFRENEVVRLRGKDYPLLSGRIRLVLEASESIVIRSQLLRFDPGELAVSKVTIETPKGTATAHGSASLDRDSDFAWALCELSESRACGRALKLLGYGLEVGFEEIGRGAPLDGDLPKREPQRVPARDSGSVHLRRDGGDRGQQRPLTGAQRRAIIATARSAGREVEDLVGVVHPGVSIDDLTVSMASAVIDRARGSNSNGHAVGSGR